MNDKFTEDSNFDFTLRDFYFIIFRHKKKILGVFFFMVIAAFLYVEAIPDVYESDAQLLVKVGRESIEMIPTADQSRAVITRGPSVNTEIEILKNPEIYGVLVDVIGIEAFIGRENNPSVNTDTTAADISVSNIKFDLVRARENIISHLKKSIDVSRKSGTDIIVIRYTSTSPVLAHKVVSNLIDVFYEKHIDVHYSGSTYDFFVEQVDSTKKALNDIEKKIAEFKNELNIGSLGEYGPNLIKRIESYQTQIDLNSTAIAVSESKVVVLKKNLMNLPEVIETERITGNENTINEFLSLKIREQELLSKYSEENIQIKEIRRQIAEADKIITSRSQVNQGVNTTYQELLKNLILEETNYASLKAKDIEQRQMLAELTSKLNQYNISGLEIGQLERERGILSANFIKYSGSLEEATVEQIVQKQKLSNISVLQPPTRPTRPLETRKRRNLALGIFMGFFGSIGLAFVSEFMDHTIKRQEDVEKKLQLKTLAIIPEYPKKNLKKKIKEKS